MNTFYYFEGRVFETKEAVEAVAKDYTNKKYDVIETEKSFDEFEDEFDKLKSEGNSDLDAIKWAK